MSPRVPGVGLAVLIATMAFAQEPKEEAPLMAPPPEVSLTGHWTLDPKLSDDPGNKVREAMKGMQGDHRRRRPPIFPGPGGFPDDRREPPVPTGPGIDITTPGMTGTDGTGDPFKQGGSSYGSSGSQSRAAFDHVQDLPETLTIAQRPALILVQEDDDEGRIRALRPDGTRQRTTNGKSEHRTRWDKGLLRVETWYDDGVHAEEIFDLAPDRSLLTVTVRVDDGDSTISLERVFRPDPLTQS
jgi:hypothetical protein